MLKPYIFLAFLCIAVYPTVSEPDPEKRYTVIGEYIPIEEDPAYAAYVNPLDKDQKDETDLSNATVSISQEIVNDNGEVQSIELARGTISNGTVTLEGELEEPTIAQITVQTGETTTLSVRALLAPRKVVSFALLDHQGQFSPDQMVLVGASSRVKDPTKRYTIVGDLAGVDEERYPMPTVTVRGSEFDEDGNRKVLAFGKVQVQDGRFLIEGEVDSPQVVNISIASNMGLYWGGGEAIIEPNSVISVVVSARWVNKLAITAGAGKHAEIIGKWRMSEQYLATEAALDQEFEKLVTGSASSEESSEDADTEPDEEQVAGEPLVDVTTSLPTPAIGCEHVDIQEDSTTVQHQEIAPTETEPAWLTLQDDLLEIRNTALQEIALHSKDPFDSLLALELNPFTSFGEGINGAALPVYDKLMTSLDEDTVVRRVKPPRDELALLVTREMNDKALSPGQRAPEFTLSDLDGTEVSLAEVLNANESVFIDFWASWCTPCIEDFPELKNLHENYKEHGFEVLTISVDDTYEDWQEAADQLQFSWIDLGSLGGTETKTPVSYGVWGIPKGFLVDSQGCILQKEIRPDKLKDVLAARYDDPRNEE